MSELEFRRLLDKILLIDCPIVCHTHLVHYDPNVEDPFLPLYMRGTVRACPVLVNYNIQN